MTLGPLCCFSLLLLGATLFTSIHAGSVELKDCEDTEAFYAYDDNSDDFEDLGDSSTTDLSWNNCDKFETYSSVARECVCVQGCSKKSGSCLPQCKHLDMWWSDAKKACVCPGNTTETDRGCKCARGLILVSGTCKPACEKHELLNDDGACVCASKCTRLQKFGNRCVPDCRYKHMIRDSGGVCKCPAGASVEGNSCRCQQTGYSIDGEACVQTCAENEKLTANGISGEGDCECIESYSRSPSNKCLPKCRHKDMIRGRGGLCKCPGGSFETKEGCTCPKGYRFNKGGKCKKICGKNEALLVTAPGEMKCVCKDQCSRDPRFGNKCLPDCKFPLMKRLDSSETCRCPGYGLGAPEESRATGSGCVCAPGYLLTKDGCEPICEENQTFKSGRCECKVGYTKYKDMCATVCKDGMERTENDKECQCRNGKVPQDDGGCACEQDSVLVDGTCEKKIPQSKNGNCVARNTIASHYWGQFRADMSKCPAGSSCEPSEKGYDCMSSSDKKDYKLNRCGSCGFKERRGRKCKPIDNRCKSGYTCSRRGRNFNCIEDSRCRIRNCGPCGQLSHSKKRCIKRQETTLRGSRVLSSNLCKRYPGKVCSSQMINGAFPCVHKTKHINRLLRAKGRTPLNICRWSWVRNRQTLFVTPSRRKAAAFKPPFKIIFMSYENGIYKGTVEVLGSEGGWIYKHARAGRLLKTTPRISRRMGRWGTFGRRFRRRSYVQPKSTYASIGETKISRSPRKNTDVSFLIAQNEILKATTLTSAFEQRYFLK